MMMNWPDLSARRLVIFWKIRKGMMHFKWRNILQALWGKSRFTSYFFQMADFQEERRLPTLGLTISASRLTLLYNPDFVESHKEDELTGLLVHEMMHILLNHPHRALPGEDPFLQNLAQDMVINSYITDHEKTFFSRTGRDIREAPLVILPEGLPRIPQSFYEWSFYARSNKKKKDPAWEEVFAWLKENDRHTQKGTSQNNADPPEKEPGSKMDTGFPDSGDEPDPAASKNKMPEKGTLFHGPGEGEGLVFRDQRKRALPTGVHFFQHFRQKASVLAIKRRMISFAGRDDICRSERLYQKVAVFIDDVKPVQIHHFHHKLNIFLEQASLSDEWGYSASRFNRRYLGAGIYAPGRVYKKLKNITVAVDVSGSVVMTPGGIENAFGVIEALLCHYKIHLLCMDEDLFVPKKRDGRFIPSENLLNPYVYQKGDWRYLRTGNRGATFFMPLFNAYMLRHREPLVVITDGEVFDLHKLKPYSPTLWVVPADLPEPFDPPFGQIGVMVSSSGQ